MKTAAFFIILAALLAMATARALASTGTELVHVDEAGVIRWNADQREVALFGANYCLPSSSDYRAAGYLGVDRKKLIEQDMAHFARMGWDGLRLAIWGDWESCDREGNLIVNDHLDLFDYLIFCAKQRGISMLFTPIHRHSALWPDGKDSDAIQGFSKFYPPSELGTNPAAIAAQQNYIRQILDRVNPYTGVAPKDEPAILFIELINEPEHHAEDFAGSVAYINALADAVRDTGCEKLLFFNLSQDFRMGPAIAASKAQGFSFGWYPTALVARRTLDENYLRWVDRYTPLHDPDVPKMPRIVYEFDSADMVAGYMYPAMVRAYREVGTQFAAMFAYDMLATAPYNLGWQTHYLNLVYSPRKAVSAIIAAEAMRTLPRGENYGRYPQNRRFGPFRVSYEEDTSEMVTTEKFLHANDTSTTPPDPAALRKIVGRGNSPLIRYEGVGSYFLDKLGDGHWRLEVYPDAILVQDPFAQRLNYQTVSSRLVWRTWPMQLALPDLGSEFAIKPLNTGNDHRPAVTKKTFDIRPGVYLLTREGAEPIELPERIGEIALTEFICPPAPKLPIQVLPRLPATCSAPADFEVSIDVVSDTTPDSVTLRVQGSAVDAAKEYPMSRRRGYRFIANLPAGSFTPGQIAFSVVVTANNQTTNHPSPAQPAWTTRIVGAREPIVLFNAEHDANTLFTLRANQSRPGGYLERIAATVTDPAAVRVHYPTTAQTSPHAISIPIKSRILDRRADLNNATSIRVAARGNAQQIQVALIDTDGTTWIAPVPLKSAWTTHNIPLAQFRSGTALKLPQGYPGTWNRELSAPDQEISPTPTASLHRLEHLQLHANVEASQPASEFPAEIRSIELILE